MRISLLLAGAVLLAAAPPLRAQQEAGLALGATYSAYFLEKGAVRYEGPSAGLLERDDLLRSVFLAGAAVGDH